MLSGSLWGTLQLALESLRAAVLSLAQVLPGVAVYLMTLILGKVAGDPGAEGSPSRHRPGSEVVLVCSCMVCYSIVLWPQNISDLVNA